MNANDGRAACAPRFERRAGTIVKCYFLFHNVRLPPEDSTVEIAGGLKPLHSRAAAYANKHSIRKICLGKIRSRHVGAGEIRRGKVGAAKISRPDYSLAEVGVSKVRKRQIAE